MININVIVKEKKWFKFLKNPESYLKKKIKKIQNVLKKTLNSTLVYCYQIQSQ